MACRRTVRWGRLPSGATSGVVGNAEVEVPLIRQVDIRGVAFFDVGNTYNTESQHCRNRFFGSPKYRDPCNFRPTLDTLRANYGFGFRWFSPVGPLRFEWAFPIDRRPGERRSRFIFCGG